MTRWRGACNASESSFQRNGDSQRHCPFLAWTSPQTIFPKAKQRGGIKAKKYSSETWKGHKRRHGKTDDTFSKVGCVLLALAFPVTGPPAVVCGEKCGERLRSPGCRQSTAYLSFCSPSERPGTGLNVDAACRSPAAPPGRGCSHCSRLPVLWKESNCWLQAAADRLLFPSSH